ncbi:cbb3-type cytochrome oxidase assembly protein [Campylobacter gastrosuis]|uniref:Cbb3-type cytochrome oxidase assembly protein n=1 Tax=Campylobacter gastrosuis TaxID=2974576 RepID=A0ABT7HNX1_9BACT|nr:cbb3-type cytochrome oxidase assembly protein [Campylobacter gastrosuis]MDL0088620.1 cbb3-type cytochrome oxidase assembly protein [Campylobacter gastrosuis]
MDNAVLMAMLLISVMLGAFALFGLIWGIKNKQFEDYRKFLDGTKFDDEDALNDAYALEKRKKEALKKREKGYMPPDL